MGLDRLGRDPDPARRSRRWRGPRPAPAGRRPPARSAGPPALSRSRSAVPAPGVGGKQPAGDRGGDQRVAGEDGPDAVDELLGGGALEQEPVGPRIQGVVDTSSRSKVVSTRTRGRRGHETISRVALDAVEPRHPDVHEDDVGSQRPGPVDGLARRRPPPPPPRCRPPRRAGRAARCAPARRRRPAAPGSRRHRPRQRQHRAHPEPAVDRPGLESPPSSRARSRMLTIPCPGTGGRSRSPSLTTSSTHAVAVLRDLDADPGPRRVCRTALVSASCAIRYTARAVLAGSSTSSARRSTCRPVARMRPARSSRSARPGGTGSHRSDATRAVRATGADEQEDSAPAEDTHHQPAQCRAEDRCHRHWRPADHQGPAHLLWTCRPGQQHLADRHDQARADAFGPRGT